MRYQRQHTAYPTFSAAKPLDALFKIKHNGIVTVSDSEVIQGNAADVADDIQSVSTGNALDQKKLDPIQELPHNTLELKGR